MSERYLITGVQLAMLKTLKNKDRVAMIEKIEEDQFIGQSHGEIKKDVLKINPEFLKMKKWIPGKYTQTGSVKTWHPGHYKKIIKRVR